MLSLILTTVFIVYVFVAILIFGFPSSISNTYYLYESKKKGLGYIFTIFLWIEAFIVAVIMLNTESSSPLAWTGFICPAGIAFCGCAVLSEGTGMEKNVHVIGAWTGVAFGILWCILFTNCYLGGLFTGVLFTLCGISSDTDWLKHKVFWAEILGFTSIITCLLINSQIIQQFIANVL